MHRLCWVAVPMSVEPLAGCGGEGGCRVRGRRLLGRPPQRRAPWRPRRSTADSLWTATGGNSRFDAGETVPPTVVLDAGTGTPGISEFGDSSIVRNLATRTRVCTYDRAGLGMSDAAPDRKRVLDGAADDLHRLLQVADVPDPYVLVGSSGGGFNVYQHAGRFPDEVVGLVMLDVPAGQANISPANVPAWDSADNPERMDYASIERQMALNRLPIPSIPVTVVTAAAGQSANPSEQRVWLKGSSNPVQVELDGGHAIYDYDPAGVLAEISKVLDSVKDN